MTEKDGGEKRTGGPAGGGEGWQGERRERERERERAPRRACDQCTLPSNARECTDEEPAAARCAGRREGCAGRDRGRLDPGAVG